MVRFDNEKIPTPLWGKSSPSQMFYKRCYIFKWKNQSEGIESFFCIFHTQTEFSDNLFSVLKSSLGNLSGT